MKHCEVTPHPLTPPVSSQFWKNYKICPEEGIQDHSIPALPPHGYPSGGQLKVVV